MFPSSRLFLHLPCPSASCSRPHCLYKHAGAPNLAAGPVPAASTGIEEDSLHELERINKEIETVTHLVEQEKKRLSSYQNILAASKNHAAYESQTAGPYSDSSSVVMSKKVTKKYVVDNSKPRTDLEYDPLSNYSSDLRANSSCGKVQRMNSNGIQKDATMATNYRVQKTSFKTDVPSPRVPSPEPPDESNEDSELVIDVSPSKKSCQAVKADIAVVCKTTHSSAAKLKRNNTVPTFLQLHSTNTTVSKGSEECLSTNDQKCENKIADGDLNEPIECFNTAGKLNRSEATGVKELDENLMNESDKCLSNPQCEGKLPHKTSIISPAANLQGNEPFDCVKQEQPVGKNCCTLVQRGAPGVVPGSPNGSSQNKASITHTVPSGQQELTELKSPSSRTQSSKSVVRDLTKKLEISTDNSEQLQMKAPTEVIVISSDEEEVLQYSDMDVSDSDPMEECYRIFMEANNEDQGKDDPNIPEEVVDVVKPEVNTTSQAPKVKRRVAHEPTHAEPLAKSRPQPQVLVPLRGPAASSTPRIQQVQQKAAVVSASVKGGQAFVLSKNKMESQSMFATVTSTPAQHAVLSCIPVGRTIINVGNNLHLLLPDGPLPLPVDSSSAAVTSVLTPISQVQTGSHTANKVHLSSEMATAQRNGSAASLLIAAPMRKPAATLQSSHASCAAPPSKSNSVKRKMKHQYEATKVKVPHDLRQRYVNLFTEEFLKTTANVNEAFEKALAEEKMVFNRSMNKVKYQSVAVNLLKRLRSYSACPATSENKVKRQKLKGNIPFNPAMLMAPDDMALYECLKDYILTDEKLIESNYPIKHPEKKGGAILLNNKKVSSDPLKRICCRCGATYSVSQTGKHVRKEECTYHYGKGLTKKVPGGVETRYSCCEGVMGTPGCQVSELHVHDFLSLDGFVSGPSCSSDTSCPGVFSLDCEMCYTIHGLELSRVTVINSNLQVVYDTFVRPENTVIDFNTRFSGISEEDMKGNHPSLKEVQNTLLRFISAETILIGHGLETDLCLLKLLHDKVVDTTVVFPHRLGPPHTLSLKKITADYLRKIIQENVCGHDTEEDASACMELMLWKVKEDGKMKK